MLIPKMVYFLEKKDAATLSPKKLIWSDFKIFFTLSAMCALLLLPVLVQGLECEPD